MDQRDQAKATADCLGNQFTPQTCVMKTVNGEWRLNIIDNNAPETKALWWFIKPWIFQEDDRSNPIFNHCLLLSHFSSPWKEVKVITLLIYCNYQKFPQTLCSIILLSTLGKLFEKYILKKSQRHEKERTIEAKVFRTFLHLYYLSRSEQLSANPPLHIHQFYSDMCLPKLEFCSRHLYFKITTPAKQGSPHNW